jgi:uncharacterized membrane protein
MPARGDDVTAIGETILDGLSQIRHDGAGDPVVVTRFRQLISDLAYTCPSAEVRAALVTQLDALVRQLNDDDSDRQRSVSCRPQSEY